MKFDQRKYDEVPLKKGELIFILLIGSLFLFMMTMEIISNYEPRKLGALLFVIFWIPLLFIHEFGHALMASSLNWHVKQINIGFGQRLFSTHLFGVPLTIRMIPLEGFVRCAPKNTEFAPLKHALIYFAGPGIELFIFFSILWFFGADWMFSVSDDYFKIALQSFAFAALAGAILNLIPLGIETKDGMNPNDGLGIILSLFSTKHDYELWLREKQKHSGKK